MLKHAYLIMAHEYTLVLRRLIQLLDDKNNSIYIHIDKNSQNIDTSKIRDLVKNSKLYIFQKYKVYWGTNSITLAEIFLLKEAVKEKYDYYHILSGADLPIKSKGNIQNFFEKNNGKEFIHFGTEQYQKDIASRYIPYHFFTKQLGRKREKKFWVTAETYSLAIQRRLRVDRAEKQKFFFYGGANWCSITGGLAEYAAAHYGKYRSAFQWTQISDELVWQTIVMDSPFRDNLYKIGKNDDYSACVRYIDWNRGAPYVFRAEDFEELIHADGYLFARKFDEKTDTEIVEMLYHMLENK